MRFHTKFILCHSGPALGGPFTDSQAPSSPHLLDADRDHIGKVNLVRVWHHLTDLGMSIPNERYYDVGTNSAHLPILQLQGGILMWRLVLSDTDYLADLVSRPAGEL